MVQSKSGATSEMSLSIQGGPFSNEQHAWKKYKTIVGGFNPFEKY